MLKLFTDTHTHTIASVHAYSTLEENVRAGAEAGLELVGITDHYSPLFVTSTDFPSYGNFINKMAIPKELLGLRVLFGAEIDIIGTDGELFGENLFVERGGKRKSYNEDLFPNFDYVIASVHDKRFAEGISKKEATLTYLRALEKDKVMILGHVGRTGLPVDADELARGAASMDKMIEINEASFDPSFGKGEIYNRCKEIAAACMKHGTKITVSTDSHSSFTVGKFPRSIELLEEIGFPEELVASRDRPHFLEAIGLQE